MSLRHPKKVLSQHRHETGTYRLVKQLRQIVTVEYYTSYPTIYQSLLSTCLCLHPPISLFGIRLTMSGSATGSAQTTKATESEVEKANESPENQPKPAASLEEDDEFEDFPVEGAQKDDPTQMLSC